MYKLQLPTQFKNPSEETPQPIWYKQYYQWLVAIGEESSALPLDAPELHHLRDLPLDTTYYHPEFVRRGQAQFCRNNTAARRLLLRGVHRKTLPHLTPYWVFCCRIREVVAALNLPD